MDVLHIRTCLHRCYLLCGKFHAVVISRYVCSIWEILHIVTTLDEARGFPLALDASFDWTLPQFRAVFPPGPPPGPLGLPPPSPSCQNMNPCTLLVQTDRIRTATRAARSDLIQSSPRRSVSHLSHALSHALEVWSIMFWANDDAGAVLSRIVLLEPPLRLRVHSPTSTQIRTATTTQLTSCKFTLEIKSTAAIASCKEFLNQH